MSKINREEIYQALINAANIVHFDMEDLIEVKPGVYEPLYVDLRNAMGYPHVRTLLSEGLAKLISNKVSCIGGIETGGSYYAYHAGNILQKPIFLLRRESKQYGDKKRIAGLIPEQGSHVALIDDVLATGTTIVKSIKYMNTLGIKPYIYTLLDHGHSTAITKELRMNTMCIDTLLRTEDLIKEMVNIGRITKEDLEAFKEYIKNKNK